MTDLADFQFEILAHEDDADGVVFGIGADVNLEADGFHPPDDEWTVQDAANESLGGVRFGRDVLSGPTWGWDLFIDRDDVSGALDSLASFKTAWRAAHIRQVPGATLPIRYKLDGRVRRFYGRPRRYSGPPNNLILGGYVPVTVDFQAEDSYTYDDVGQEILIPIQQGSDGGIAFPLTMPYTSVPISARGAAAVVVGDADSYPVITISGPVDNPSVETDAWYLALDASIPAGAQVIIDARPGRRSVVSDGAGIVGLARRTRLSAITLPKGSTQITYRGTSESSASTCRVRWANAWNSI